MTTDDFEKLKLSVKQLIVSAANLPQKPEEIDDRSALFQTGLSLDSIDILEVVVQLEKKFGLKLRNNEEGKQILSNVESLSRAIADHQSVTSSSVSPS